MVQYVKLITAQLPWLRCECVYILYQSHFKNVLGVDMLQCGVPGGHLETRRSSAMSVSAGFCKWTRVMQS